MFEAAIAFHRDLDRSGPDAPVGIIAQTGGITDILAHIVFITVAPDETSRNIQGLGIGHEAAVFQKQIVAPGIEMQGGCPAFGILFLYITVAGGPQVKGGLIKNHIIGPHLKIISGHNHIAAGSHALPVFFKVVGLNVERHGPHLKRGQQNNKEDRDHPIHIILSLNSPTV